MPHKTDDPLAQLLAARSPVRKQAGGAVKAAKKLAPGEQKMLQGFYRGFAGEFDTPTVSRETGKIFVSPQKAVGEHYARRRAMQAGSEPHLEMILADPFAGRGYGHAPATTARERTLSTVARQLAPEDIVDIYQFYAGGGLARKGAMAKAREIVSDDLFHGGDIKRGDLIDRPLFMTPSREMAQSYADFKSKSGNVQMFRPQIKKPAPERLVNAAARRYVPENEALDYSPASAFDRNLHDPMKVQALIDELERRGYDAAVATDVGMGGQGAAEAPAVIRFPGQRAYADGGRVTPEEMHGAYPAQPRRPEKYDFERAKASLGRVPGNVAEFVIPQDMVDVAMYAFPFGKVGKVLGGGMVAFNPGEAEAGKMDTARRALLGLRSAPEPQAGALVPRVEQSIEKIAEMPVSRRTLFKGAGSQALQSMLPARGIVQALSPTNVAKEVIGEAVRPAGPTTMQGIIAQAARMGLDDEQTLKLLRTLGPGAESDALYMIDTLRRPMDFVGDLGEEAVGRGRAMANLLGTDVQRPMQMRGPLREIRRENPEMYEELRQVARDVADYGHEF
jgi:hypothetical protein